MGQFKDLLKKQMNYLKRKYGNGLILLSPEELVQHGHEFKNDFTNMQGLERFIDYLKRLPGMFDPQDESDVEMERLYNYYLRCVAIDGAAGLPGPPGGEERRPGPKYRQPDLFRLQEKSGAGDSGGGEERGNGDSAQRHHAP